MEKKSFSGFLKAHLIKFLLLLVAILVALILFFIFRVFEETNSLEREIILTRAQTVAVLIHKEQLASLKGDKSDLANPVYIDVKFHLMRLRDSDPFIRSIYLIRQTDTGKYISLMNSESPESRGYSPPGQVYGEATKEVVTVFQRGTPEITKERADDRGVSISVLVPIRDEDTSRILAVLGIDYPVRSWRGYILNKLGYVVIIVLFLVCLAVAAVLVGLENAKIQKINEALQEKERRLSVFLDQLPGMAFKSKVKPDFMMTFVSKGCEDLTGYSPEMLVNNKSVSFTDLIAPEYRNTLSETFRQKIAKEEKLQDVFEIVTKDKRRKWVFGYGQITHDEDGLSASYEGILLDITERKRAEEEKKYLNDHDPLTGLYNRRYFLETIVRFEAEHEYPVAFIVGNVNGLSLFNSAFGEKAGDELLRKAGELLLRSAPEGSVAARLEGDGFALIIPFAGNERTKTIVASITRELRLCRNSHIPAETYLDLSLGYASSESTGGELPDVFKSARQMLHHARLLNRTSDTHGILKSLLATLYEKSGETEEHSARLACVSTKIGERLGLSEEDMNTLRLLAMLHDVGKIGIDDRILKKPGPLTEDEWKVMRTHPQIGYRIAMASSGLNDIAPYILAHHERWDGKGYPRGLKGEEIPLLARILSLADAFDAMTSARVYKEAWERQKVLEELKKNAGTQFDPKIVDIFLSIVDLTDFNCQEEN